MVNRSEITPDSFSIGLHILRARIVQLLSAEGYNIQGSKWEFRYSAKGKLSSSLLRFISTDNRTDKEISIFLNPKVDLVTGRTKFGLYKSLRGDLYLSTKPNKPDSAKGTVGINCKECSGRQFVSEHPLKELVQLKFSDIKPCSKCNSDFKLKDVTL